MIWALADPHLSLSVDKPMDIFGEKWENHIERLAQNWRATVAPDDIVIIPGDISWGINFKEAAADLRFLHELPGTKYISRGNHDYWWSTIKKINEFKEAEGLDSLHFFRSEVIELEHQGQRILLFGTRGWSLERESKFSADDAKILQREVIRLRLILDKMNELHRQDTFLICAMHYPPLLKSQLHTGFTELLEEYGVPLCLYGHLHSRGLKDAFHGKRNNVLYINVAADYINMQPVGVPLYKRNIVNHN